jgi:hypothetical protein
MCGCPLRFPVFEVGSPRVDPLPTRYDLGENYKTADSVEGWAFECEPEKRVGGWREE